ncbi:hypothetical protein ABL78_7875 [Leptomonas seymouri]|uniref:Transmembrane protein n=1 Tax=Leptomonas seymouri TaxID=5684 RepID=A0A0N0P306_LEPSE|nr:hypothetical protein ABL78_7875 [Leptomonas seymouri]|eukprot:KPI83097.1 hypothetical protein ABL78_7875 [Leptomonas seymouri]
MVMHHLRLWAVHCSVAQRMTLVPSGLLAGSGCPSFVLTSRRTHHHTLALFTGGFAQPSPSPVNGSKTKAAASTGTATSQPSPASASSAHYKRGDQIRRNEEALRWLRRLVVPAFFIWGLFVLRPTEGHFLRYVAERRHLDPDFNAWFPPVAAPHTVEGGAANARAPSKSLFSFLWIANDGATNTGASPLAPSDAASGGADVLTAFRSPQDRDWAAQRFNYTKGSEDEERVARRRLLFARERAYLADDTVVETIRSPEAQMEELRTLREHPPMHLLREQLDALMADSKQYMVAAAATREGDNAEVPTPPQILIKFEGHRLYATGAIVFCDTHGHVGRTMRFAGACGMLWKQIS